AEPAATPKTDAKGVAEAGSKSASAVSADQLAESLEATLIPLHRRQQALQPTEEVFAKEAAPCLRQLLQAFPAPKRGGQFLGDERPEPERDGGHYESEDQRRRESDTESRISMVEQRVDLQASALETLRQKNDQLSESCAELQRVVQELERTLGLLMQHW
ncbi:unnamed protein product, partial [Effrenium voratum]